MLHSFEPTLDILETLPALSRAAATYDTAGIDLTQYFGRLEARISAGTFGASATLDVKWQESDDNSTFTDITGAVLAQKTAAGYWELNLSTRKPTKRYVRLRIVVAVAAVVFAVITVAKPLKAE